LYGNTPTIFYNPDDETAPSSTWTEVDPHEIKDLFLNGIDTMSAISQEKG